MDPRAGLDDLEKRKFLTLPALELRPQVIQPVPSRYTDLAIPPLFLGGGGGEINDVMTGMMAIRAGN
jgi:hypothetical protein